MFINNTTTNNNNNSLGGTESRKGLLIPVLSIFVFLLLVFSATYAYFTVGSNAMNTATHNITLPSRTSLTCKATPVCAMSVTYAEMVQSANNNTTPKKNTICYMNCTCSGSSGGKCNYNVNLQPVVAYSPSASLGTGKEYTVNATIPTGCTSPGTANTTHQSAATEIQVNTVSGKIFAICNLSAGSSANVALNFHWYNVNLNQDAHAGKTYRYKVNSAGPVLT